MRITPENVTRHELTGLPIHVVESTDPNLVCKKGTVVGESKKMIQFSSQDALIAVPKGNCVFNVTLPDGTVMRINGDILRGRPEDRMKKRLNRSW